MSPQTGTAVLVLVVFVLPGFVALRYAEQTYLTRAEDSGLERVLSALYFSLLSYLLIGASAWLFLDVDTRDVGELWRGEKAFGSYLALAAAGMVVPLALAEGARRWSRSRVRRWVLRQAGVSTAHKTPSGWEHFFLQGRWAYVRATLKDGRVVGGWFGPRSFAGYTAETPDLYLEQRMELDPETDWFTGAPDGTLGLYIRADEIVSVEFYDGGEAASRPRWWRRAWSRITGHGNESEPASGESAAADPQVGRDLPGGAPAGAPDASSAGAEGRRDIGPSERS
jgi:hypothetical protein